MCDDRVKISYFDDINNQREFGEIFPINYDTKSTRTTTTTATNSSSSTSMYTASYHLNRINDMKNLKSGQRNSSIIDANESFLSFHKFPQMYFSMQPPSSSSSLSLKDTENFTNTKNRYTSSTLMSSKMEKNQQQQQQRTRKINFIKGYNESSNNTTANTSTITKATSESGVVGVAETAAASASTARATTINNIKESESNHRKNDINETYKRKLSCVTLDSINAKDEDITKKMKYRTEKDEMFEIFQPWALKTYGDQAKTKTITHKKKTRILRALNGKEQKNLDTSKFRFWVKSKGFTTKRPDNFIGYDDCNQENCNNDRKSNPNTDLFVVSFLKNVGKKVCRKVAIVEEFFEIIYNVHVDVGGRGNRHAGQKRTYRIITESYAFLPREAVTKFLTACPTCKKNLRPGTPSTNRFEDHSVEDLSDLDVSNNSVDHNLRQNNEISNSNNNNQNDSNNTDNISLNFLTERTDNTTNLQNYQKSYSTISDTKLDLNDLLNNKFRQALVQQPNPDMIAKCISSSSSLSESWLCSKYNPFVKNFLDNYLFSINNQIQKLNQIHYSRSLSQLSQSPFIVPFPITETSNSPVIASKIDSNNSYFNYSTPVKNNYTEFDLKKFRKSYSDPAFTTFSKISSIDSPSKRCKLETNNLQIESNENESMDVIIDLTMNTSDSIESEDEKNLKEEKFNLDTIRDTAEKECFVVDLRKVKPITSTYLKLTRTLGLNDKDALKIDDLETVPISTTDVTSEQNVEDPYAMMKDADKLKLMLLAWNYQNSNAVRNGGEAPDLGVVGGLWAQYQNALALNAKQPSVSPVNRTDQSSPIENQDETNSSSQKDEDDISEDDSDDKLDQNAQDPERLKAFNMFVRLFVDENLDRMIPISKQPKEKIQAIIDSCARQFPEFCERSRKRIRTYLKSCRRNKKAREGWDNTSRPTPAHLTSVQAEQILAIACENESLNAKRMRVGLDPISQSLPLSGGTTNNSIETIAPSTSYPAFRTTPNSITTTTTTINNTNEADAMIPSTTGNCGQTVNSARSSPVALLNSTNNLTDTKTSIIPSNNGTTNTNQISSPLYRPADFTSPTSTSSSIYTPRSQAYTNFFQSSTINNATPTDLSMKQQQQQQQQQQLTTTSSQPSPIPLSGSGISPNSRNPIVTHKLSANEITAARQVITAYRESAAFLLRTADQVEQLLLQQQ